MVAYDLRLYRQSWVNDVNTQAELPGQMTAPALSFGDARVAKENLALLRYRPSILAAAIYDARGRLFATFAQEGQGEFPRLPEGDGVRVGAPFVDGARVKATVVAQGRGEKLRIFKLRRRKHYAKTQGHRQSFTEVRIDEIVGA